MTGLRPIRPSDNLTLLSAICLAIGLMGVLGLAWATALGPGLSPDSVHYVAAAESLSTGHGLIDPISSSTTSLTRFPPLYPAILAAGHLAGLTTRQAAVWLNGFMLIGLLLVLVGLLHLSGSRRPRAFTILAILITASPVMFGVYVMAWTEPLFIFLCYASILCTIMYLRRESPVWLIGACVAASAATLTRYVGIIVPPVVGIGLFLFARGSIRRRVVFAGAVSIAAEVPLIAWWVRNLSFTGSATSRQFAIHPLGLSQIKQAVSTLTSWVFLPAGIPGEVKLAVLLGLAALIVFLVGPGNLIPIRSLNGLNPSIQDAPEVLVLLAAFVILTGIGLGLSLSFVDANTPMDNRILSPIFPALAVITSHAVGVSPRGSVMRIRGVGLLVTVLVVAAALMAWNSFSWAKGAASDGIGFSQPRWRTSEVLGAITALPESLDVYSNAPEAVFLYTHRQTKPLPTHVNLTTQSPNAEFGTQMDDMRRQLESGDGVIVYFSGLAAGSRPDLQELRQWVGADLELAFSDGALFGSRQILRGSGPGSSSTD